MKWVAMGQYSSVTYSMGSLLLLSLLDTQPAFSQLPPDSPHQTLQQSRQYYRNGKNNEAAKLLQQAISDFAARGDTLNEAIAWSNLALVWQNLGEWEQAMIAIDRSLNLLKSRSQPRILASVLNIQGQLYLQQGQASQAHQTWKQAEEVFAQLNDVNGVLTTEINQAQALQALGLYRQALRTLQQIRENLRSQPNSLLKATGLRSLAEALRVVGQLDESETILRESLEIAQLLGTTQTQGEIWLSLGNTYRAQQQPQLAIEAYQQAEKLADSSLTRIQAQLNHLRLLTEAESETIAIALWPEIRVQLSEQPASRKAVYLRVNLAESLLNLPQPEFKVAVELLSETIAIARQLQDKKAEAYSLGSLAAVYEQTQQWSIAERLTEEALLLATAINAPDISYRWQWQLGRLLKAQGKTEMAIAAYNEAVNTLESLRTDLVAVDPDVQFSFRESVEPVYRQLVSLILQPSPSGEVPSQESLKTARELIQSLQLAELDNFFREACLDADLQQTSIDQVDRSAAVIYPIILSDRIEVILSLPDQPLRSYSTPIDAEQVDGTVEQLRQLFIPVFSSQERRNLSKEVYNWLVRPAEVYLNTSQIETLVFVLDGSLRNLPMAALHDGQQYLIEKYNLALTPSLKLLAPQPIADQSLKTLTLGLSEARQGFIALPAVELEIEQIQSQVPAEVFLNQKFTKERLEKQLNQRSFSIVHLATHGQFSSQAEETFLLTWDGRINVKDFDRLLRNSENDFNPIELLVLSACQTATGDQRAALGLAGVAVRSGARSTLATLWQVNDVSTAFLMTEFYRQLALSEVSKAEALRSAQLKLLQDSQYQDPYYWAAFVLVGNWL
ncbi:CHAT domain-containing protein [Capilliphycus salinus ALCB114379]|uniref:CHAT domain-containing protein n=1 Tax=Capilliphycus salinus TaxID=2768948 RepID=UPI0039A670FE